MSKRCPIQGECLFSFGCENIGDGFIRDMANQDPSISMIAQVSQVQADALISPIAEAASSEPCLREKVRALKTLGLDNETSNVSAIASLGIAARLEEIFEQPEN